MLHGREKYRKLHPLWIFLGNNFSIFTGLVANQASSRLAIHLWLPSVRCSLLVNSYIENESFGLLPLRISFWFQLQCCSSPKGSWKWYIVCLIWLWNAPSMIFGNWQFYFLLQIQECREPHNAWFLQVTCSILSLVGLHGSRRTKSRYTQLSYDFTTLIVFVSRELTLTRDYLFGHHSPCVREKLLQYQFD